MRNCNGEELIHNFSFILGEDISGFPGTMTPSLNGSTFTHRGKIVPTEEDNRIIDKRFPEKKRYLKSEVIL